MTLRVFGLISKVVMADAMPGVPLLYDVKLLSK